MVDVHDRESRSRNMAAVKAKNTRPELLLRRELFRLGFRYRIHYASLPGTPDIVLPKYHAVIQVHGCFWHGHGCELFQWPASREDFWRTKITGNVVRDQRSDRELRTAGWRVLTVWECAFRRGGADAAQKVVGQVARWLRGRHPAGSIPAAATP